MSDTTYRDLETGLAITSVWPTIRELIGLGP